MSNAENLAIVRRAYESINQSLRTKDFSQLMQGITAEDVVDHNPQPGQVPGLQGLREFLAQVGAAFPDYQVHVEDLVADGDTVAARLITSGTNEGPFMGIPATGKKVKMDGMEFFRIAGGKVVERWGVFDTASMMMQMGLMPPPGG